MCLQTLHLYEIWGFHGGEYEECRLLGHTNPVRTSQETHYVSATETSLLILGKIWGFHVVTIKNAVLWDVTSCGSCKPDVSEDKDDKNQWTRNISCCITLKLSPEYNNTFQMHPLYIYIYIFQLILLWKWWWYVPTKRWFSYVLYGAITQKTTTLVNAVRI
jgi:hypothetical protein